MDKLAKKALNKASYSGKLICWSDLKPKVNAYIHTVWQKNWDTEWATKLQEILPNLGEDLHKRGEGASKNGKCLHESMPYVVRQLQLLWSDRMIRVMFAVLLEYIEISQVPDKEQQAQPKVKGLIKKALGKSSNKLGSGQKIKLESGLAFSTCLPCCLYQQAISTLTQLKMDILGVSKSCHLDPTQKTHNPNQTANKLLILIVLKTFAKETIDGYPKTVVFSAYLRFSDGSSEKCDVCRNHSSNYEVEITTIKQTVKVTHQFYNLCQKQITDHVIFNDSSSVLDALTDLPFHIPVWGPWKNRLHRGCRRSDWDAEGANKLHEVLPNLGEDLHRRGEGGGRKLETAMCRFRVGHTWLTQSYLLKNEDQPFCYACDSLYTVRHILIECLDFQDTRKKYFSVTDLYRLFREVNASRIVGYLKDLGVYGNI
ncbi:ubiquitin-protein ligase e3b [Plakobranchus ocellatus]|uniref:Ubiquitin-protein ligase e3b n=1 Tax=Plakobranchus ocellatus TaxID=259542 RepID=A0AAV4B125_9GAST|nr:ubiquitin-protein ligase e3b [Plakobranchus ocellatus]